MQIFLPYADFQKSATVLDNTLLGSQIVFCNKVLNTLHETDGQGDYNHPVVRMWKFYEYRLAELGLICVTEWERRGYIERPEQHSLEQHINWAEDSSREYPMWFGDEAMHQQYRRILIWMNPHWYDKHWPEETPLAFDSFVYP
jgi:hypothetical protein